MITRSENRSGSRKLLMQRNGRWSFVALHAAILLFGAASPVQATPPTPPWVTLERSVERDGLEQVRVRYHDRIRQLAGELEGLGAPESSRALGRRMIQAGTLVEYLSSWSLVEARQIYIAGKVPADFRKIVWEPLLALATQAAKFRLDLEETAGTLAEEIPAEQFQAQQWVFKLVPGMSENVDIMARRLALLAKVSDGQQLLPPLFEAFDGTIGTFTDVAAFRDHPHDMDRLLQVARAGLLPGRRVQGRAVDPAAEKAIGALVDQFFRLAMAGDVVGLEKLFVDSSSAQRVLDAQLRRGGTPTNFDKARYTYTLLETGAVFVRIEGLVTSWSDENGRTVHVHDETFVASLTGDQPQLISVGGVQ